MRRGCLRASRSSPGAHGSRSTSVSRGPTAPPQAAQHTRTRVGRPQSRCTISGSGTSRGTQVFSQSQVQISSFQMSPPRSVRT
ncbi:hypothetical protein [Pseudonocardia sp. ICBG1034]|uniref:hypothetical protein n=1 Tax=Pseudonocardia sp. ICBG1034 TaxID=2844381 RepID=UPI001CC9FC5F|nr:hypothetical protein [Pseudonocardia sp. ICBG1034]